MTNCNFVFSCIFLLSCAIAQFGGALSPLHAQELALSPQEILAKSTQGREFWFAIPPNETLPFPVSALEIYVTSAVDTEVTLEHIGSGAAFSKKVKALEVTTFSNDPGADSTTSWEWEIREHGVVGSQAIRITAPDPVSVYVLSMKPTSSEGFLALPKRLLGADYIHVGYYDLNEHSRKRGNGFVVIGTADDTEVDITLNGVSDSGSTTDGKLIGETFTFSLDQGQTYSVKGNGLDTGFDLTGSRIQANKPIGVISYHERAIIPVVAIGHSRDHLVEMMTPVSSWGKTYITKELERNNRGDFFRVIAAEDNTAYEVTWYDKVTGALLGELEGILQKSGDFSEYLDTIPDGENPKGPTSIRGVAVWKADKPIFVMQYSYSNIWDKALGFDPFMMMTTPVEQFARLTVFQSPFSEYTKNNGTKNYVNILAVADTTDPNQLDLKSITLDGTALTTFEPQFLDNRVPGTNIYWATVNVEPGAHTIQGDTDFGANVYGAGFIDAYAWPAAMLVRKIDDVDTNCPLLTLTKDCADFAYRAMEQTFGAENDADRQIDQGINAVDLLEARNMELNAGEIVHIPAVRSYEFGVSVIDTEKEAYAIVGVTDRAGNIAIDTITYAPGARIDSPIHDFGDVLVGDIVERTITLENSGIEDEEIQAIALSSEGASFTIVRIVVNGADVALPFVLEPSAKMEVVIEYLPLVEGQNNENTTLSIDLACSRQQTRFSGRGVLPHILVEDFDAGTVLPGAKRCKEGGLLISNPGTAPLQVTGIAAVQPPFSFEPDDPDLFPLDILPGASALIRDICYQPQAAGENSEISVEIQTAFLPDADIAAQAHISRWRGSSAVVSVAEGVADVPAMEDIRPNPAQESAFVRYRLASPAQTQILIHDAFGRLVLTFEQGHRLAGVHEAQIDIAGLASGMYYTTLKAGAFTATGTLNIVR